MILVKKWLSNTHFRVFYKIMTLRCGLVKSCNCLAADEFYIRENSTRYGMWRGSTNITLVALDEPEKIPPADKPNAAPSVPVLRGIAERGGGGRGRHAANEVFSCLFERRSSKAKVPP